MKIMKIITIFIMILILLGIVFVPFGVFYGVDLIVNNAIIEYIGHYEFWKSDFGKWIMGVGFILAILLYLAVCLCASRVPFMTKVNSELEFWLRVLAAICTGVFLILLLVHYFEPQYTISQYVLVGLGIPASIVILPFTSIVILPFIFKSVYILFITFFSSIHKNITSQIENRVSHFIKGKKERKERIKKQNGQLSICETSKLEGALSKE